MATKKSVKIILWIVAIFLIIVLVSTIGVKLIFTKEKLLSMIEPRLEEALNREVEIKDVSISILGGLGADVKGMTVYEREGFIQKKFLTFERFSIRVKFFPLLKRKIEIKKIILEKPVIGLEKNKQGFLNIDDLVKKEGEFTLPPIVFEKMEIKDGKIDYFDQTKGYKITLEHIGQQAKLSLDPQTEIAYAKGKIEIKKIDLNFPTIKKQIPEFYLSLEHNIKMNFLGDSLLIEKLKITLGEVEIDLEGRIKNVSENPFVYLNLSSENISASELLGSIPFEDSPILEKMKSSGKLKISATYAGEPKLEPFPQIEGKVVFREVKLESSDYPFPFNMPYGEINFDSKSLSFFSSQAKVCDFPVEIKAVVDNYKDPNLSLDFKADLDLSLLENLRMHQEMGKLPEGAKFKGFVKFDFKAYGKIKKIDRARLSGNINLRKIEATHPLLGVPLDELNGDLNLIQNDLKITNLFASLGKSSFSLDGKIENLLSFLLKKTENPPLLQFTLSSPYIDLDEIFPAKKEKGEPKMAISDTIPFPYLNLSGQINVQKLLFREVEFSNLAFQLYLTDGILELDNFVSNVYTGNLGGKAKADLNDPEHLIFNFEISSSNLEANDFLSRFTPAKDHLFGKLNLVATFSGEGNTVDQIKNTLSGAGNATITDGKLINLKILNLLSEYLKIKELKDQKIKNLKNSFRIEDRKLHFENFFAQTKDFDCELSGYITLDGYVDYYLTLYLSPQLSKRFDLLGELTEFFKDEKGRLVLDIVISGQASAPKFALQTSRAEKLLQEKVKIKDEKLKKELEEKAKDFLQKLLEKK